MELSGVRWGHGMMDPREARDEISQGHSRLVDLSFAFSVSTSHRKRVDNSATQPRICSKVSELRNCGGTADLGESLLDAWRGLVERVRAPVKQRLRVKRSLRRNLRFWPHGTRNARDHGKCGLPMPMASLVVSDEAGRRFARNLGMQPRPFTRDG